MNEVVPLLSTTNQALAYENRAWTLLRDPAFLRCHTRKVRLRHLVSGANASC